MSEPTVVEENEHVTVYDFGGIYGIQVEVSDGRFQVRLPHSCDEWVIAEEYSVLAADKTLQRFAEEIAAVRSWLLDLAGIHP